MIDFDFIEEKLNYFFNDGIHRIVVIPKDDSDDGDGVSEDDKSSEKHAWESSKNGFTTGKNGSNLR